MTTIGRRDLRCCCCRPEDRRYRREVVVSKDVAELVRPWVDLLPAVPATDTKSVWLRSTRFASVVRTGTLVLTSDLAVALAVVVVAVKLGMVVVMVVAVSPRPILGLVERTFHPMESFR